MYRQQNFSHKPPLGRRRIERKFYFLGFPHYAARRNFNAQILFGASSFPHVRKHVFEFFKNKLCLRRDLFGKRRQDATTATIKWNKGREIQRSEAAAHDGFFQIHAPLVRFLLLQFRKTHSSFSHISKRK